MWHNPEVRLSKSIIQKAESLVLPDGRQIKRLVLPEWQNCRVNVDYEVSFELLSDRIVLSKPCGIASVETVQKVWDLRQKFVIAVLGKNAKFLEVRDYQWIPVLPNAECRKLQVQLFQQDAAYLLGFYSCNMSTLLRNMMRVGRMLKKASYPWEVCGSFEQALVQALDLESRVIGIRQRVELPEWFYEGEKARVQAWVIPPHIMGFTIQGNAQAEKLEPFYQIQADILRSSHLDLNHYYRIFDLTRLTSASWKVRFQMAQIQDRIFQEYPQPRGAYVVGASAMLRAVVRFVRGRLKIPLDFSATLEEALLEIGGCVTQSENDQAGPEFLFAEDQDVQQLIYAIGILSWEGRNLELPSVQKTHRFAPIYEALALVQAEFQSAMAAKQRQAELEEQARLALETANRGRREFLRIINHELRTPLNGILGMIQLIEHQTKDPEILDFAQTAHSSGESLLLLVNDLLELTRIESGKAELLEEPFELDDVIQKLEALYARICKEKGLNYVVESEGNLQLKLLGDHRHLHMVLNSLLANATKFTSHGSIYLRVRIIEQQKQAQLVFEIQDTGIGIRTETLPHIFDLFNQEDMGDTRRYGGMGVGLTIAHQLTQLLGGTLGVQSESGEGSLFTATYQMAVVD